MEQEKIQLMKTLHDKGEKVKDIAKKVGVSRNMVYYYISDKFRKNAIKSSVEYFKRLPKERKSEIYKKRKSYINSYIKNKYKTNPEFRKKEIQRVINYRKSKVQQSKGGKKK